MRESPHNFEAEQAVLGAVLADNAAYHQVADFLEPAAFADPAHGKLWTAIGRLMERGQPASPATLRAYVESDADLSPLGIAYLGRLVAASPPTVDAIAMAGTLRERYIHRQADAAMREAIDGADLLDPMATIAETAQRLGDLADSAATDATCRPFSAVTDSVLTAADSIFQRGGGLSGLETGFAPLDVILGGLHPGELVILAARPAMGKSALAADIGFNVASAGVPAGEFSLEMSAEQMGARIVSGNALVAGHKIRQGTMPQDARKGSENPHPGAVAAFARRRAANRQAAPACRPARVRQHRAGRRRGVVHLSPRILPGAQRPRRQPRTHRQHGAGRNNRRQAASWPYGNRRSPIRRGANEIQRRSWRAVAAGSVRQHGSV
jgi:hypothetical protein